MKKITLPSRDAMYRAVLERDSRFEGIFVLAVKTTGIFCRPTCTARKPNPENVEYFQTAKDALQHGYRPCRKCNPMEPYGAAPDWIESLVRRFTEDPAERLTDSRLRAEGVDPARVRRWFKRHHGMTFHAYLRLLRINRAYGNIRQRATVTDSAFSSGYESLSGFGDAFRRTAGFSPSKSRRSTLVTVRRVLTPLGPMVAGATDEGVCLLEFADRRMLERQLVILERRLSARLINGAHPLIDMVETELAEYFNTGRHTFETPLFLTGTLFQLRVWNALQKIPYGEVRSYKDQAVSLGQPAAVRAVARANGDNRIAILIPCHRVVGSDGSLTGYGGGLERKRYLLDLERSRDAR